MSWFDVEFAVSLLVEVRPVSSTVRSGNAAVLSLLAWHLGVVAGTLGVCVHSFLV